MEAEIWQTISDESGRHHSMNINLFVQVHKVNVMSDKMQHKHTILVIAHVAKPITTFTNKHIGTHLYAIVCAHYDVISSVEIVVHVWPFTSK